MGEQGLGWGIAGAGVAAGEHADATGQPETQKEAATAGGLRTAGVFARATAARLSPGGPKALTRGLPAVFRCAANDGSASDALGRSPATDDTATVCCTLAGTGAVAGGGSFC